MIFNAFINIYKIETCALLYMKEEMAQHFWKILWHFHKKKNRYLPYDNFTQPREKEIYICTKLVQE